MKLLHAALAGLLFLLMNGITALALAQENLNYPKDERVTFTPADSSMGIQLRMRTQNRIDINSSYSNLGELTETQFRVRRMRLEAEGFIIDPRLTFEFQLGFSRDDLQEQLDDVANLLFDAFIQYALTDDLSIRFGQFVLPGNRQRVIGSRDLQLIDRSIANSAYNLDRDVGLMLMYSKKIGKAQLVYFGAMSNGVGRNILDPTEIENYSAFSLAFTQRLEFLPLGRFTGDGDYFESDLLREKEPKLSVGGGYFRNNDAIRTRSQRGPQLYGTRDINSTFADMIFKYRGFSLMAEYLNMYSPEPITQEENDFRVVQSGAGYMIQAGYVWPSLWEIAGRYSSRTPNSLVTAFQFPESELLLGVSRYIRGHRIKFQSDIGYITDSNRPEDAQESLQWRIQMELGF